MEMIPVQGYCRSDFESLRHAFEENFRSRGEVGAAVCIYRGGECVVDLWGGLQDPVSGTLWSRDTIVCMMSVGKAFAALSVLLLAEREKLSLDSPVAAYWPAFAEKGKEAITVRQVLAGLAALIFTDAATRGAIYRWDEMTAAIEQQAPAWQPGSRGAYHSTTLGFLAGELVRRVDGRRLDRFFDEEIAHPLDADFQFGLRDKDLDRVSDVIENRDSDTLQAFSDTESAIARAWKIRPAGDGFFFNDDAFRKALIPSSNGHGNARAVARIYNALVDGGGTQSNPLISPRMIEEAREEQWNGPCGLTGRDYRMGLGFFLNKPPLTPFGPNPRAFGHPGLGGANGFADPENGIAFGYSPNALCGGDGVGDRCEALIDATFRCI